VLDADASLAYDESKARYEVVTTAATERVPLPTKILYGVGEIAISTKMTLFGLFVLFFYNSVLGLPAIWVGLASAIGLIWDAILDPYIGYRSDVSESRYGRRHPFMLAGAATMGLSFWLIWAPPPDLPRAWLFGWLLTAMLLFRFTSALFRIPYLGLGAEMSADYHERTSIVGVRSFFGLAGSLSAASLSFYLFFPNTSGGADPKLSYEGYPRMGLVFAIVMTVAAVVTLVGTRSRRLPEGARRNARRPSFSQFVGGLRTALENPCFRKLWFSFSLFFVAVVLNGTVSVHFFTWYAKISDSLILSRLQGAFYLSALLGVGFWVWAAKRREKLPLYLVSATATAGLMGSAPFLFGEGHPLGTGDPAPLFVLYVLAGFCASALWVLPASMVADVGDEDSLRTGSRREGLFFGILNFGEKIAAGLAVLIGGALMDYFAGLIPGATDQSPETVWRIALVYGAAPALLLLMAVLVMFGYRLNRAEVASIQARLKELGLEARS
jgi:glycoside/pentoside/hexuronide:cation symporter, GPH family